MWRAKVSAFFYFVVLFLPSEEKCAEDKVCVQMKTHGMLSADCYNKNIRTFPQCLRSDVEIIELSYNRIRKITKEELSRYRKLKMLYLADNLLTHMENSTFEDLSGLMSLDLSLNGISHLPPVVFHLPSLKRLYLSQNQNINIIEVVEETKPITSPLETLDISFNELETLPNFGVMPNLWLYNISGNNLVSMKLRDVAGFCNLKKLANSNFTAYFDDPCDCWNLQTWLEDRNVNFTKIRCDVKKESCPYTVSHEDLALYDSCLSHLEKVSQKSSLIKIAIAVGVVIIVVLLIIVYLLYRYRKNKKAKLKQEKRIEALINGKKELDGLL
ncbi:hypothetical protein FQR65_LT03906 [Abscondita terminalis]|nr:hypothetical protein FQR65_LT03906 [Abscondita terminalis]